MLLALGTMNLLADSTPPVAESAAPKPSLPANMAVVPNKAPPPPQAPRVPSITLVPSRNPDNKAWDFIKCSRGDKGGCARAGAWLAAHATAGRELRMCLHAVNGGEDLMQCLELEAEFPK
jgi:hypothetical protein